MERTSFISLRSFASGIMNIHRSILIFLLAAVLFGCKPEDEKVFPQDRLTIEYVIDQESILVGDPVELILTACYPTNGTLQMPDIGREKDIVLLKRSSTTVPRTDGLTQSETRYSITSFRLGEHSVSAGPITCMVDDKTFAADFPDITLSVKSSLPENASSELADIKSPHKLPGRVPIWLWLTAGTALAAFLIGLMTSGLWKNREQFIPSAPVVPPHVIALKALAALNSKGLLQKGECKPFYTELSMILRTYLEGRFKLNAPDETTEEIVEEMSRSPELTGAQRNILQEFMRQADMVKFARGESDRETMQTAFNTAEEFIEQTKLTEEPDANEPGEQEKTGA